ncbi:uncharacterized protein LOC141673834 [Apium graveolens]|uniref:uncharacterized protein LOC141673834 n=1 Tax=Apium graveolens TaxID=4045 RepID=UPI003D793CD0
MGFANCFSVDRIGRSGVLAVLWHNRAECNISGYSQNHVDVIFNENNVPKWRMSCFYGMPERTRRKQSWELIYKLSTVSTLPWCIMGDFNDLLYPTDKEGTHPHPNYLMNGFRNALEMSSLSEIDLSGGRFTWEKGRGTNAWVKERLDRGFANANWWSLFPLCNLKVVATAVSDHEAIFLQLVEATVSKKTFRFKFENTWLKEPSFISDVKNCWENLPMSHLMIKLMSVSRFMEKWGRDFFNKFKEKVRRQKAIIDLLRERTDDHSVREYLKARDKLNDILLHEELYWKQRAKLFWLREGDENTRFFHTSATTKKKANRINFLVNEDRVRVDKVEDMGELIKGYYQRIFAAPEEATSNDSTASPRIVTQSQNNELVADVTFEEFTEAMNQMHPDKASGPDGLNPAFYQNFWKVLGNDVFECCRDWLQGTSFPADLNHTNIVLIPKKDSACSLKDFRPIALCNVLYKIMAKVLANRLKHVLPGLISDQQSAFVPSRCITDNVVVAFELIHHMKGDKRSSEGEVTLKLDISKAYDRVNWDYLKNRMQALGFSSKWISWVMRCVTTVSYEVCFNGMSVGPIIPKRGLRQGDPLSPYLFLFCVEGLSNLLNAAAEEGYIHGGRVCTAAPEITHLLFVDDSFLFFKATREEALRVKGILNDYADSSGQSVNYLKSGVFYSANVRSSMQEEISGILGVHGDITTSNYLGLPSLIGRSKKRVLRFVKERVCKRIDSWKAKPISRAGKTVLIRNVAQSLPSYCMMCFLLPKTMIQDIERQFNAYWWSSGSAGSKGLKWLSWDAMSEPKYKGGMGFRNMYGFNIALLGKHIWRCIQNPELLVTRVLKARYFSDSSILEARKGINPSFVWMSIWQAKEKLSAGYRWVVGDGRSVTATRDPWLAQKPNFRVDNLQMYEGRQEKVATLFYPDSKTWDPVRVRESFSSGDALAILATNVPQRQVEDRIVWSKSIDGIYSVKTGYYVWQNLYAGDSGCAQSEGWRRIWRLSIPHKVKIFVWRFCRNNVPIRDRLRGKGVNVPDTCPMCNNNVEQLLHLFFLCQFADTCWQSVDLRYDMGEVHSVTDWLLRKLASAKHEEIVAICLVLWGIWNWRNKRVWQNQFINPSIAMESTFRMYKDWKSARKSGGTERTMSNTGVSILKKWQPPDPRELKLNVDASFFPDQRSFSVGMVLRDQEGSFVAGKCISLPRPATVMEAESIGVREALSWMKEQPERRVTLETDSLLVTRAVLGGTVNLLEVGHVLEHCRLLLRQSPHVRLCHVRKQANRVAHCLARVSCSLNCFIVFTSPPTHLVEIILNDLK